MNNKKLFIIPNPISNPKIRLFCFPFAGGSVSTYMPWVKHFGDGVELVLVQPPGRGSRITEQPHDNMSSLIDELMDNASYITRVPFILFGHSLGSRVAFELSCQLKFSGMLLPEYFIASGSRAPHLPNEMSSIYDLPHDEFIQKLEELNGTDKKILFNQELMKLLVPLLRADFKIADNYQANKIGMPFPILVLHGKDDIGIQPDQVAAWRELSEIDYKLVQLNGDHFFINQYRGSVIAQVISVVNKVVNSINSDPCRQHRTS